MPNTVASGGSGTVNGVIYQLLWTLLRVAKLRVATPVGVGTTQPGCVTVIVEPHGGGGDLQLKGSSSLVVEQIKARSGGGPWSLRNVIEDVLPDLFLAVEVDTSKSAAFRFVTEGRMGAWRTIYEGFFRGLQVRDAPDDSIADLDDSKVLTFIRKINTENSFFPEPCTERRLFLKIIEVILDRPAVKKLNLSESDLHRRVRFLLRNFDFLGGQDIRSVQQAIDALLLTIVDKDVDIPSIRDHLAMELAKASATGGAQIEPMSFLADHGLDGTPLTDWATHLDKARALVYRTTQRNRYDGSVDVRQSQLPDGPDPGTVLVVTGESGTGKSWMLSALAIRANGSLLPILIESEGTSDASLQRCAEIFWNDIHDGDEVLSLSRVAKRLKKITQGHSHKGLAVFIDGVRNYEEARRLVEQDWMAWSSGLVLACRPEHAYSLQSAYPNRVQVHECRDFTWEELHDLMGSRLEFGWPEIPIDVRETLRRPLLAGIYFEEFGAAGWEPQSEYELYQRVWGRLSTGEQSDWPLDASCVESLGRMIRVRAPYPWSPNQLRDAGIDNDGLIRLQRIGWLVAAGDRYRIFHDRLLQWVVARSLCSDLRDGNITVESLVEYVTEQVRGTDLEQQIFLGYIPMDVLWILNQGEERRHDASLLLLKSLENVDYQYSEILYNKLVPTLGKCIADSVYSRLSSFDSHSPILKRLTACLAIVGKHRIEEFARPLLESNQGEEQLRGVNLLRFAGCPPLLDQLWKIHIAGQRDPTAFGEDEKKSWLLYQETFDALEKSVRESPDWLCGAIEQADPAIEPVHDLGWLVAGLNDGGRAWYASKQHLFKKTSTTKPRSLVANISRYRDLSELEWLGQWIGSKVDQVSPLALQALSRLNPDAAVVALRKMEPFDLMSCRKWSFAEVFERRPAATQVAVLEWMKTVDDPWKILLAFEDRENDISLEHLNIALDALYRTLIAKLEGNADPRRGVHLELAFLSKITAPELLQVLRARRATAFESTLVDYVLSIGPQLGLSSTGIERKPAMAILQLIGGRGITTITNEFLVSGDQYGKHEAIEWAAKRPDELTFTLLREIVQSDDGWSGIQGSSYPVNQNEAMKVLAQHGHWESVADGIKKWEMRTSPELKNCPELITEPWLEKLRHAVDSMPTAGNVLAIGAVGGADDCSRIHKTLSHCDLESELAHACIIALDDLDDRSDEGVALVARHLGSKKQRYSATRMLQNARTSLAWLALFKDLDDHFDFVIALNLINLSEHGDAVAEIVLSNIPANHDMGRHSQLKVFLTRIRPERIRNRILSDSSVRECLHQATADTEGSFWFVGSKANAIECMAEFDSAAAFSAACHALADFDAHDRERYPSILTRIDLDRGIAWLVGRYPKEKSQLVRVAICRTLGSEIPIPKVLEMLRVAEDGMRVAAAELAGWAVLDDSIDVALATALDDQSDNVVRAAIFARQRRRDRRNATSLSRLTVETTDPTERAVYFDALIGIVDPGDKNSPLSPTTQRAFEAVSEFQARRAVEKLEKRRKELFEQLKKEDSR